MSEWYHEFVDDSHEPEDTDVVVLFRYEPDADTSQEEALGRIASESSVGTWTTLAQLPDRLRELKAVAYEWDDTHCKVAYPAELWEPGNLPQLLSGIAGNIFGMKAVEHLRLEDVTLPPWYLDNFLGPAYGIQGLRDRLGIPKRPLTASVPKPKLGWSAQEHAELARETWVGGIDLVKDDENLTSQTFNRFEKRVELMTEERERAEQETGETKSALINITAETNEAIERAKLLSDHGWEYAMVDVVTVGFAGLQTIRKATGDLDLAIHAHRAMHATFTKLEHHGISMPALSKLLRLVGVDQLHTGTVIGKLVSPKHEVLANNDILREQNVEPRAGILAQDWCGLEPAFPVSSGGLHPGIVPEIMDTFGNDCVVQLGGGVHGHPDGTEAGARTLREVIDGHMEGRSLEEMAEESAGVAAAFEKWGTERPK